MTFLGGNPAGRTDPDDPFLALVARTAEPVYGVPMQVVPMIGGSRVPVVGALIVFSASSVLGSSVLMGKFLSILPGNNTVDRKTATASLRCCDESLAGENGSSCEVAYARGEVR